MHQIFWAKVLASSLIVIAIVSAGIQRGAGGGGSGVTYGGGASSYGGGAGAYGGGGGAYRGGGVVGGGSYSGSAAGGGAYSGGNEIPTPYEFNYNVDDGTGNTNYHQETGDGAGGVRGTYGYTDSQGLYRIVEYVADAKGYRATVKTNEPGTENKSPADANFKAEAPPAGIQDRYTNVQPARPAYRGDGGYGTGTSVGGGYTGSVGAVPYSKPAKTKAGY